MSITALGAAAVANAPAAYEGVKQLMTVAGQVMDTGFAAYDAANPALTRYLKQTMLSSRVYIDGNIAPDAATPDIIRSAQTIYASLVLNALQLDQMVAGGHTVKELLRTVATESMQEAVDAGDAFTSYCGTEAFFDKGLEAVDPPEPASQGDMFSGNPTPEELDAKYNQGAVRSRLPQLDKGKLLAEGDTGHFPTGRMIEVTLKNPVVANAPSVTLNLLIQMFPYIIRPSIATEFLKLNASPGILQRWTMWRAGEIGFWRDFVFHMDIFDRKQKVMRTDTSGVLSSYLQDQLKKDRSTIKNLISILSQAKPERSGRNIANSVMIFSEETVMRTKAEIGFDLHNKYDRERYFRQTYTMLLYVIDPMFDRVKLYMNGIDAVGEYTIDQFKGKGKNNDVVDMLKAIQAMNQGRAPRF